ncbi:MAG TPA: hypothetical protein VGG10_00040 [Rhizomicrobium sp.]|jgi:hypothetical protein
MFSQYARLCLILFALSLFAAVCLPLTAQDASQQSAEDLPTVLRITSREVVIDVVARDQHNDPISDLAEGELQVFELGKHRNKEPRRILSFRKIDPHRDASRAGAEDSGFRISSGPICALNAATHYEIAIQASPEPGIHQIEVLATQRRITLAFRHRYYVGVSGDDANRRDRKAGSDGIALHEAACFHSLTPSTLAVTVHPLLSAGTGEARYAVIVRPESLAGIGLGGDNARVQLDFGMCTFDGSGTLVQYLHSSIDRMLKGEELQRAQTQGLSMRVFNIAEFAPPQ